MTSPKEVGHRPAEDCLVCAPCQSLPLPAADAPLTAQLPHPRPDLSPREYDVLDLVARGYSNTLILNHLPISIATLNAYLGRLRAKFNITSRPALVHAAYQLAFAPIPDQPDGAPPVLNNGQAQLMHLQAAGLSLAATADRTGLPYSTVNMRAHASRRILAADNQAHAVSLLYEWRLLTTPPLPGCVLLPTATTP
ncbi:response regulator transcription factor [Streptomyces sp. NPDC004111]|uniref:helix-turn-helix transcriptional regulator n=1 Tax=Streptomyces sp. NPDC004111 TaxID=3364690 RepID=UPI0036B8C874